MKIGEPSGPKDVRPARGGAQGSSLPSGPAGAKPDLVAGQLVKGQVVGFSREGNLLLEINGQRVEAKAQLPLALGSSFWLEVKQTEPLPFLALADKKGAVQEFLQQFFSDPGAMGRGLRSLLTLAELVGQGGASKEGQAELLQNFAQAAVGREADPAQLIRWLSLLGAGGPAGGLADRLGQLPASPEPQGGMADQLNLPAIQKLAVLFDLQHELNSLPAPGNQPLSLLFPCFFALNEGAGQWLFTLERQNGAEGEAGYNLAFFLEMSRVGEVEIRLKVKGEAVSGEVVVGSEKARDHFRGQLGELEALLGGLGYEPVVFSCRVGVTGLLPELKSAVEEAVRLAPVRVLDLKV
ncbi:MAG: flagellar hook-length control protein FliK [Desulfobulbaceae bacterium]|nr:flagellar hook-length control protein FliK [Desulfobulbaceae bacterium]